MLPASLRKAAILISSLEERAADALLEQMGPEQAAKVRCAMMELETIEPDEERQILAEFLHRGGAPDDVQLELSTAAEALAAEPPAVDARAQPAASAVCDESPFAFLHQMDAAVIAREVSREHPQTVAAVLANLPPDQAAGVLEALPTTLATDSLERMATIDDLAPEVIADLANELKSRLLPHLVAAAASAGSLERLSSVLGAMDYRRRQRIVLQLAGRNAALASRLGLHDAHSLVHDRSPAPETVLRYRFESTAAAASRGAGRNATRTFKFSELADLHDDSLRAVLSSVQPETVLLALTGADERLIDRIARGLSAAEAAALRRRLNNPGPLRLREIDAAQRELAAIAADLLRDGRAEMAGHSRFAAAA